MLLERLGAGGLFEADDDSVELWIDVVFFLLVFGVLCALSSNYDGRARWRIDRDVLKPTGRPPMRGGATPS